MASLRNGRRDGIALKESARKLPEIPRNSYCLHRMLPTDDLVPFGLPAIKTLVVASTICPTKDTNSIYYRW